MTPRPLRSSRGFALWELLAVLVIIAVTIAIIYPVRSVHRQPSRNYACASNLKQVGLTLMQYVQDNDDTYPPLTVRIRLSDGNWYEQEWGFTKQVMVSGAETAVPSIIGAYVKPDQILQCPSVKTPNTGSTYLYSDLAAGESLANMTHPFTSIVTVEGEDRLQNVGHARSQSSGGAEAVFYPAQNGKAPKLLIGAAIGDASIRHAGGGNYGFADGHVQWMKPEDVFFPPRTSNSSSHREAKTDKLLGPDPAGATQSDRTYQGKLYKATFHVN